MTAKQLDGSYNVTLDAQGLFAMSGESAVAKKSNFLQMFKADMLPEQKKRFMQSIARDMGLNPAYYLPDAEPLPPPPTNPGDNVLPPFFMDETPEPTLA